jgi:hypothetical protein
MLCTLVIDIKKNPGWKKSWFVCASSTPEAAKKRVGLPMSLQKQNSHKLTVEAARGAS